MKLQLPIRPAEIPSPQWDIFLEKYYLPYLQANYVRILREGVSQRDVDYFSSILDQLSEKYYSLSGLGFWGALIGGVISAIPAAIGTIANYKLGKSTLKLQKEEIEARKQREAAESAMMMKQQEAMIQQAAAKPVSTVDRAVEVVTQYSPYLMVGGIILIGAIFLLKRR